MRQAQIAPARIDTDYVKFGGGLDLATPVLSIAPGCALDAVNYEQGLSGGYKRIDGFERVDGRAAPSAASYTYLRGNIGIPVAAGAIVIGSTSGATGVAVTFDAALGAVCITATTGTFQDGEELTVGGLLIGAITETPAPRGCPAALSDATALAAAADYYRGKIGAVPGSGPVRGVWMYQGTLYAWRDNVGATACVMYKATSSGWTAIAFGEELAFTNANTGVVEGVTIVKGGASATVARVVLQTGSLASGVNTGRLIIISRLGGNFSAGAATVGGSGTLTLSGAQTPITFLPGGRFEFVNTNFSGSTSTFRMYGCDGKNRAFEFDGTTLVPISTGMTPDTPKFITVHKKKLFLAFKGSVQYSGDGLPYQWTLLAGANEIGMGDDITGMLVQAGDTLAIFTRNSSWQLNGSTNNSFSLVPISAETGGIAYTAQNIGQSYMLDDRGVVQTQRTQAYGNFEQGTITRRVQKLVDKLRANVVGSTVYKSRNQYRLYGSDGSGLIVTFDGANVAGITALQYPVSPTCFAACEDTTGADVVFFGAADGYVYQADRGSSFDGQAIEAILRMPFNNVKSPRLRKRFRRAVLEMSAENYAAIRFQPEFSYSSPDIGTHRLQTAATIGGGGYWDVSSWEGFFYDAAVVGNAEFSIEGTGTNMALLFYSASAIDLSHTLQGMHIHFSPRRLER